MNGDELRTLRQELGMLQVELADAVAVPTGTIARWERGEVVMQHGWMLYLAIRELARQRGLDPDKLSVQIANPPVVPGNHK